MKKIVFLTLATAASVAFAQNTDTAGFKAAHDKAAADYKVAKDRCDAMKGNAEDVCEHEAKLSRARAEANAVAQYKSGDRSELDRANRKVADAEYELAKEKCDDLSGNAKNQCQASARSMKNTAMNSTAADGRTAVLVPNADRSTVAANAADVRDRTANAASNAADRTAIAAENAKDKTVAAAHNAKEKTADMAQNAKEKTAEKTADASQAMSDTMITAKVKADMAADKTVTAMDVHVETQQGVVMLSGFVPSKAEADRAVQLAKGVKGVSEVKSSIQVKGK
jgi:osmotically-inducible protein OsmY